MIEIRDLQFSYPKSKIILDELTLNLMPGSIYGLFGGNGEGKSTLIKILAGLLFPKKGSYHILGENIIERKVKCLQEIFIVPEDFDLVGHKISTYEKINSPFFPKFSKDLFYNLIKEFRLSSEEKLSNLSFGQKKKVLISFGIATNCNLLLLDEPTNGLDIPSKSQFRKIMASAVDEGKCIVISTHQVRDLHSIIDHVVILDQSKIVFNTPLSVVSELLWFGRSASSSESIIYTEAPFGGKIILPRKDREETEIDLELLFNAVLVAPLKVGKALKNSFNGATI